MKPVHQFEKFFGLSFQWKLQFCSISTIQTKLTLVKKLVKWKRFIFAGKVYLCFYEPMDWSMLKDNLPIPLSLSGKYSDSFLMLSSENSVAKLSNRNFLLLGWIGARIVLFSLKFMVMIKDFCRCSVCYLLLCSSSLTEKIGLTGTFRAGAGCKYRSSAHCCYCQHLVLVSKTESTCISILIWQCGGTQFVQWLFDGKNW